MNLVKYTSELQKLAKLLVELPKALRELVNSGLEEISALERDKIESKKLLNECKRRLQALETKLGAFIEVVKIFLQFGNLSESEVRKIKKEYKNGNSDYINNYISQIRLYLKQCKECYQHFKAAYDEVKTLFKEVSDSIVAKIRRAQWNRATAVVAKGTVIIGDAAGWILKGSAKLPMLNAAVAEKIDALGRAAEDGAAGARAELQRYIDHFEKAQETFHNMWERLQKLDGDISDMNVEIAEMLRPTEINFENVDKNVNNPVHYEQFCSLFDILLDGIRRAQNELCPPQWPSPTVIWFIVGVIIAILIYTFQL